VKSSRPNTVGFRVPNRDKAYCILEIGHPSNPLVVALSLTKSRVSHQAWRQGLSDSNGSLLIPRGHPAKGALPPEYVSHAVFQPSGYAVEVCSVGVFISKGLFPLPLRPL
jgi:hypothetical protein